MEIKLDSGYKGTRILFGDKARVKRDLIEGMIAIARSYGYQEIMIPIIQKQETYEAKVGAENNNLMFKFEDRGNRQVCLAPEYTAVVQQLSRQQMKHQKDVKMFYIGECFRGENPQYGRWRQFTQFGIEVINPSIDYMPELLGIAEEMIGLITFDYEVNTDVTRGLDYYKDGKGFEISCPNLGSAKQICGGGSYEGGIGFAIGVDRLLLCDESETAE
jgi:histidyl-tRNA synthetase